MFRHSDADEPGAGQVWVLWASADSGDAQVEVPVWRERVARVRVDGSEAFASASAHRLILA